jgi:alkanesulfonate monooxygenase SsuD/methylene tetrahydromethanopterin reductase-like flavin-dependent oxidoreductase (luciferase family)
MELGLYSFGDSSIDPGTGKYVAENVIFKNLLERIKLADEVGLNYFGLGEHHREDYPVSSPAILLAAAASQTQRIHLGSSVSVLPTKDPVRLFQQFSTLDQITEGRAELTVGTGAYIESYPLFGHELAESQANFTEKVGLLRQLNEVNPVTFRGEYRAHLNESGVWPRPFNEKLNIWVATGETPESSERAASFGFNANYSFLSAPPASKKEIVQHYREVSAKTATTI